MAQSHDALRLLIIALFVVSVVEAGELTGDALFEGVLNGVGARGCAEGGVFRTCLNLKQQQCNAIVRSAAHMCFQRMSEDIPKWASPDIPHLNEGGYPLARSIDSN
jgi:hypothetical protein